MENIVNINKDAYENEMRDENTLNFWVEQEKKMATISAQLHPQLQVQSTPSIAALEAHGQTKLNSYELLHLDAANSLIKKWAAFNHITYNAIISRRESPV